MESLGTFTRLFEDDEEGINLQFGQEESIDAAVTRWLHEHRDTLLHLTTAAGQPYVTRASRIHGWIVSTPETREKVVALDAALMEENKAHRLAAGLPWEDG